MRLRVMGLVVVVGCVLGTPRESDAFLRWIHELSGPGPFGGATVRVDCDPALDGCVWLFEAPDVRTDPLRIVFDQSFVWGDNTVAPGTAKLLSVEPGVEYWFFGGRPVKLGVGGGLAYYRTLATGVGPNRNKVGASARVSLWLPDIAGGWHPEVSLYGAVLNKRFSEAEFGGAPGVEFERALWGVFVAVRHGF